MPELNLEVLNKNKKKKGTNYRPYDIPEPKIEKDEESSSPNISKGDFSEFDKIAKTSRKLKKVDGKTKKKEGKSSKSIESINSISNLNFKGCYTRIQNDILETLYKVNFSANELRFILLIFRETVGWNKPYCFLSKSDIVAKSAITNNLIYNIRKKLRDNRIIEYGLHENKTYYYISKEGFSLLGVNLEDLAFDKKTKGKDSLNNQLIYEAIVSYNPREKLPLDISNQLTKADYEWIEKNGGRLSLSSDYKLKEKLKLH